MIFNRELQKSSLSIEDSTRAVMMLSGIMALSGEVAKHPVDYVLGVMDRLEDNTIIDTSDNAWRDGSIMGYIDEAISTQTSRPLSYSESFNHGAQPSNYDNKRKIRKYNNSHLNKKLQIGRNL